MTITSGTVADRILAQIVRLRQQQWERENVAKGDSPAAEEKLADKRRRLEVWPMVYALLEGGIRPHDELGIRRTLARGGFPVETVRTHFREIVEELDRRLHPTRA
jgi:hypothetical protein